MRTKKHLKLASAALAAMMAITAVMPVTAFAYTCEGETDDTMQTVTVKDKAAESGSAAAPATEKQTAENQDKQPSHDDGKSQDSTGDELTDRIGTVVNVGSYLHLRDGASMNAKIIGHLLNGDTMKITGQDGDWYKVVIPEKNGYVHGDYVAVSEAKATAQTHTDSSSGLTPDGNLTLIDDIGSATGAGQQFITFETKSGNTFYMVIDRSDKGDENVHFLNLVDEADLMALMEDGEVTVKCTCTDKCEAGHVDTDCPVCRNNMSECTGKEKEPEPTTEPETPEEPEQETKSGSGMGGLVLFLIVVLAGAGGAVYYLKFRKPKADTKGDTDLDDYDFGDEDEDDDDVEYVTEEDLTERSDESVADNEE